MGARTGLDLVTYLADSVGTPVYDNPVGVIKDESIGLSKSLADVTDRRSDGWRLQKPTLKEGTVTITMTYDPDDADYQEFQEAFFNDTQVVLFLADGDATETGTWYGLLAAFEISNFGKERQMEDGVVIDVELVLNLETSSNLAPRWHSVTVA
ncbi:hypothetical protein [Roseiconus lacunae]|uniref:hypothetical protein n=1 Tax=Roseiconus lacunae TaxID=2605694 RepID=UPI0011F3681B|nr:hypothetical protein [Roseiconus lacunae]